MISRGLKPGWKRAQLGLPPLEPVDADEIAKLLAPEEGPEPPAVRAPKGADA